jgi:hypothetical protein
VPLSFVFVLETIRAELASVLLLEFVDTSVMVSMLECGGFDERREQSGYLATIPRAPRIDDTQAKCAGIIRQASVDPSIGCASESYILG